MPLDTYHVNKIKELIIAFIRARGPSLPVHLARDVKTDPLFVNAFLSEMYNEGKIKMTYMKIGSSSLYYLPEQAIQLENSADYLNQKEKEAFQLIKEKKILVDEILEPAIRVALRNLKDFAIPFTLHEQNTEKIIWKYFLLSKEEEDMLLKKSQSEEISEKPNISPESQTPPMPRLRSPRAKKQHTIQQVQKVELALPLSHTQQIQQEIPEYPFVAQVKKYLNSQQHELLQIISATKKECKAIIALNMPLGKQEFLLVAKDKKRLKAEECLEALKEAHARKMPALVLAHDVEKKASAILNEWRNFLKFEKLM